MTLNIKQKAVFGQRDDDADYQRAITNIKADRFKPLDQFLKGDTTETKEKNIELLAWLIHFNPVRTNGTAPTPDSKRRR